MHKDLNCDLTYDLQPN